MLDLLTPMRRMIRVVRSLCLVSCAGTLLSAGDGLAAEKLNALVFVKDALTVANEPATIEAKVVSHGLLPQSGLGGEPLELLVRDSVVASAMTGGDGKARFTYTPKAQEIVPIRVRIAASPRVASTEGEANLVVWERRSPILVVEHSSLIDESSVKTPLPGIGFTLESGPAPAPFPDAADELDKLTRFYYHVIYAVPASTGTDGFQASAESRSWLKTHKFPTGYVLMLPSGEQGVGHMIDEFHAAGWTTVKTGIGRTKAFAEAFVQRRLDVVMVPEPKKGDVPRKAAVAKSWKEIRKKLQ